MTETMTYARYLALDELLAPLHLSVQQLKAEERYAEDVF